MINEDKPDVGVPETYLEIGSGFNLLIGGIYKLIIGIAGQSGMVNTTKPNRGLTWGTIATTWATEVKSWEEASQLLSNNARTSSSIVNQSKP